MPCSLPAAVDRSNNSCQRSSKSSTRALALQHAYSVSENAHPQTHMDVIVLSTENIHYDFEQKGTHRSHKDSSIPPCKKSFAHLMQAVTTIEHTTLAHFPAFNFRTDRLDGVVMPFVLILLDLRRQYTELGH